MFLRHGDIESGPLFSPERYCSYMKSRRKAGQEDLIAAETAVCVFVPGKMKILGELTNAVEQPGHIHRKLRGIWNGKQIDLVYFGIGAPIAASNMEEMACLGTQNFITFGSAGGLQHHYKPGSIILPTSAIREEGTSHHYLPPDEKVGPDESALSSLRAALSRRDVDWDEGVVWTTDAPYREYAAKVRDYRQSGVLAVEMECAAVFAVAKVLNVRAATLLYVSDVLGEQWEPAFVEPEIDEAIRKAAPAVLDAAVSLNSECE